MPSLPRGTPADRFSAIGWDGIAMLLLSLSVMAASGGVSLLLALARVVQIGRRASTWAPGEVPMVVLGVRLEAEGALSAAFRQRLARALDQESRQTVHILGGVTRAGWPAESLLGQRWLIAAGMAAERIRTEQQSRHTLENLRELRTQLGAPDQPLALITARWHLARSLALARGLGLKTEPCGAEDGPDWSPRGWRNLLAEAFLLHWYVAGATFSRAFQCRKMLARIS